MRTITEIILHCSATPEGRDYTVADIDRWHREMGFSRVGYHFVVYRDGSIHIGRPVSEAGAHCRGHNRCSIGVCYIGGVSSDGTESKDTRTPRQRESIRALLEDLLKDYPNATVHGHNEFATKSCPSFKVPEEL